MTTNISLPILPISHEWMIGATFVGSAAVTTTSVVDVDDDDDIIATDVAPRLLPLGLSSSR